MAMIRCKAGEHFYDDEMHTECPYCQNESDGSQLKRKPTGHIPTEENFDLIGDEGRRDPDSKTIGIPGNTENSSGSILGGGETIMSWPGSLEKPITDSKDQFNPPVGWVIVIDGPGKGKDLKLLNGHNSIGRGPGQRIRIDFGDATISRDKHASIIYDYEDNNFFIAHNEGKSLTKLNGKLVTGATELNAYDKIKIGKTTLLFIPLCNDQFNW